MMIWAAIACFGLAASLGIALAIGHSKEKPLSATVAYGHGMLAAAGILLLVLLATRGLLTGVGVASLIVFLAAALGGFTIFSTRFREGMKPPVALIAGHALAAVTALTLLVVFAL